jgi:hypothetical protein
LLQVVLGLLGVAGQIKSHAKNLQCFPLVTVLVGVVVIDPKGLCSAKRD